VIIVMNRSLALRLSLVLVLLLVPSGCTSHPHHAAPTAPPSGAVVVASFNFDESRLLADIYAQALRHAGIPVRRELDLGPRELVWPALRQGLVDVLPEYLGTATATADPSVALEQISRVKLLATLRSRLAAWRLTALRPAAAVDQNTFAVTRATARRYALRTLSDLARVAPHLVLGGPSECPQRPLCMVGLHRLYGIRFRAFKAFDEAAQRQSALTEGVVDVELTFSTDGRLATGEFVPLRDNKHLQPVEAIVPVVSDRVIARYGARLTGALNAVSAALDSRALRFLNWRVSVAGKDVSAEAQGWLRRHGLLARR
jgi:osmoprotectant transport system substrate-binding protein